ncbi:MAG TPA: response regulator [Verrucomicrobiae bacterium]|nr:response regulator [Verrucomicrobiae bacterium]
MGTKVLLVEDEKLLRESYQIILEAESFDVDTAVNGLKALELCHANTYDLILLDIMMPELDGIGFLKKFIAKYKTLPTTIILSNLGHGDEINQALQLGAKKYIQKSQLDPSGLVALLHEEVAAA